MHLPVRIHRRLVHKAHGLRAVHHRKSKARFHPHTMSLRGRAAVGCTLLLDTLHWVHIIRDLLRYAEYASTCTRTRPIEDPYKNMTEDPYNDREQVGLLVL